MANFLQRIADGVAERFGSGQDFVPSQKDAGIPLSLLSSLNLDAVPPKKQVDYLRAYEGFVFACVNARASEVATLDLTLYQQKDNGEVEEVDDHEVLSLLRSINDDMSLYDLLFQTQAYKDLAGELFWYLVRPKNREGKMPSILEIWPLRPDWVHIKTDKVKTVKEYSYEVPGSKPITLKTDEVIHFKRFDPLNPHRGRGIVEGAARKIDIEKFADEYNSKFFENSAIPSITLETESTIDEDQYRRMITQWKNQFQGRKKAHLPAILENGIKANVFSLSHKDLEFIEGKKMTLEEILAMFQVPKSVLGMSENVKVGDAQAAERIFARFVVRPQMRAITDDLTEFLLPMYDDTEGMFFDFEDPVPVDEEVQLKKLTEGVKTGFISPNEARQEVGLDPVDGLDRFFMPMNVMPVASEIEEEGDGGGAEPVEDLEEERMMKSPACRQDNETIEKCVDRKVPELIEEGMDQSQAIAVARSMCEKPCGKRSYPKAPRKEKKDDVKVPAKTLKRYFRDELKKNIKDDILREVAPAIRKAHEQRRKDQRVEEMRNHWPDNVKDAYWKAFVDKAENYEGMFKGMVRKQFNRQRDEIIKRINAEERKDFTPSDINSVLFNLQAEDKIMLEILVPVLETVFEEQGKEAFEQLGRDAVSFDLFTETARQYLENDALKGVKSMNRTTKKQVRKVLVKGFTEGKSIPKLKKDINSYFGFANDVRAERIARSEIIRAGNAGALEAYRQSGVVAGKEWFTSEDERVCQWCALMHERVKSLNQEYFQKGERFLGRDGGTLHINYTDVGEPPLHANCRCTILPVVENIGR